MTAVQTELDLGNRPKLARVWLKLIAAHDLIFSEANKTALDHLVIKLSVAGYAIHLALIFLSRSLAHPPPLIASLSRNYLAAINTPVSIILFYEALTLITALPASSTRSIASQYEIVSLIFIRDVFKDIAKGAQLVPTHRLAAEAIPVFIDMWAALVMFLLVAVFRHVALQRVRLQATPEQLPALERFIAQKKLVTLGLATLLLAMAAWDLAFFLLQTRRVLVTGQGLAPTITFYKDLFTVMIFADVLVLILSLVVSARYEMVFRNAAFVASITLIRRSLAQPNPLRRAARIACDGLWSADRARLQLPHAHSDRRGQRSVIFAAANAASLFAEDERKLMDGKLNPCSWIAPWKLTTLRSSTSPIWPFAALVH